MKLKVIDVFAGAGGLSVGAFQAGATVSASLELDSIACETLTKNSKYHGVVINRDASEIDGTSLRRQAGIKKRDRLILVGGPPCQPFSKAAYWTDAGDDAAYRRARAQGIQMKRPGAPTHVKKDQRRDLVREFWRLVLETDADGFVFENVPSIKHPRNRPIYEGFVRDALEAGFKLTEVSANAAEYGVAQTRERVFVLGSRRSEPIEPRKTHSIDEEELFLPRAVSAGEALDGFSSPKFYEPEEVVSGRWAKHLEEVPPGGNYKAHTEWAGHPSPTFVTETRFWNFLLKLSPNRPSWTLAATPGPWTGPFHWDTRRLRTAELAALQGFPRSYVISGGRRDRVRQLGNAVPVTMAKAMVRSVLDTLE